MKVEPGDAMDITRKPSRLAWIIGGERDVVGVGYFEIRLFESTLTHYAKVKVYQDEIDKNPTTAQKRELLKAKVDIAATILKDEIDQRWTSQGDE